MKFLTLEDPKDIKVEKGTGECDWCEEDKDVIQRTPMIKICFDCINQLSELIK